MFRLTKEGIEADVAKLCCVCNSGDVFVVCKCTSVDEWCHVCAACMHAVLVNVLQCADVLSFIWLIIVVIQIGAVIGQ